MKIYPQTTRILTLASITAAALLFLYITLLLFIERESKLVNQLESSVLREVDEEQEILSLKSLLLDTKEDRRELDSRFLREDAIATFLEDVEELGVQAGAVAKIDSVSVQEEDGDDVTKILDVSANATGSWGNVFHFLTLLESLPLSLTVERVAISLLGSSGEEENIWRGSFDISIEQL